MKADDVFNRLNRISIVKDADFGFLFEALNMVLFDIKRSSVEMS